jgi:histidine triad (HIT) family protein
MKKTAFILLLVLPAWLHTQSAAYVAKKDKALAVPSPFEKIIVGEEPRELEYEDEEIVVFKGLRQQAPVHFLIVPIRRIPTIDDLAEQDALLVGKMVLVAQKIARKHSIDQSGYRLVFNTNEDSGQSVFHIHLHLPGGRKPGPMVDQR